MFGSLAGQYVLGHAHLKLSPPYCIGTPLELKAYRTLGTMLHSRYLLHN